MLEAFEVVAATGKRVSLHAETNSIMERRETRMRQAGRTDPLAHIASRPAVVAVEAVSRAAILAEWTGARIHILHISSAEELRPLREAKARGVDITGETCPQYLLLSTDDYARFAGVIRVNPPVREARNQQLLWAALADGTIDMIATDHAPHSPEEKTRNDIWTVDCGFPGVETQMPLMLTEVMPAASTFAITCAGAPPTRRRSGGFIRARASSSPAPTPTSPWSISHANGRSTTPNFNRSQRSRRSTAGALRVCRSTRWCAAAS